MAYEPSVDYVSGIIRGAQKAENKNYTVAVGGPGGSGKTTFAIQLNKLLPESDVIHTDDYRLPRIQRNINLLGSNPAASNIDLLLSHLELIRKNESFKKPVYDSVSGTADSTEIYTPGTINIIEGELSTINKLIDHYDYIIYLKTPLSKQLTYRVSRDRLNRKYSFIKSLYVFLRSNLIDYKIYNYRAEVRADIIVRRIN
jgi:uridine kinase